MAARWWPPFIPKGQRPIRCHASSLKATRLTNYGVGSATVSRPSVGSQPLSSLPNMRVNRSAIAHPGARGDETVKIAFAAC
jgi:hypothetical protein